MCGYFWIGFIAFMLAGKKLTDYTNLFCPHDFKKNDNIILSLLNAIPLKVTLLKVIHSKLLTKLFYI